jgi:hypothetical protein
MYFTVWTRRGEMFMFSPALTNPRGRLQPVSGAFMLPTACSGASFAYLPGWRRGAGRFVNYGPCTTEGPGGTAAMQASLANGSFIEMAALPGGGGGAPAFRLRGRTDVMAWDVTVREDPGMAAPRELRARTGAFTFNVGDDVGVLPGEVRPWGPRGGASRCSRRLEPRPRVPAAAAPHPSRPPSQFMAVHEFWPRARVTGWFDVAGERRVEVTDELGYAEDGYGRYLLILGGWDYM